MNDLETIIADLQSEIVRLAAENVDLKAMLLDKSTTIERIREPLPVDRLVKLLPTIQNFVVATNNIPKCG